MKADAYAILVEFASATDLIAATKAAKAGHLSAMIEAYSPYRVEELEEPLKAPAGRIARWGLCGALLGGLGTYGMEWYSAVYRYPINVGGRPDGSWPAFVPPALEMLLLWAAVFAVCAMLLASGLPRFHHPLFEVPAFDRASDDRFFLVLRKADDGFDGERTLEFVQALRPVSVSVTS